MNRVESVRDFLVKNKDKYLKMQTFNCQCSFGDYRKSIYRENGVEILYCPDWNYLEILGLTEEEYNSLDDLLDIC